MNDEASLCVLLVDDEEIVRLTIGDYLRQAGHQVDAADDGLAGVRAIEESDYDLAVVDVRMPELDGFELLAKADELCPEMPVVMVTGHADMEMAIRAMRLGAADFLPKPVKLAELDAVLEKSIRQRAFRDEQRQIHRAIPALKGRGGSRPASGALLGASPATDVVRSQIREVVEAGCETILITGETGTGKEVTAQEIHVQASSPGASLVAISCATLTESLAESELFGHVRGAFTGATEDRMGCFELADGSTLLLDEAGDLSLSAQAKVLRVLETRSLRRVGGSDEITVNLRVIAATNAPLEERVRAGSFRADLFHRLNAYSIHLSPLRDRREDILPLAEKFLADFAVPRGLQLDGFSAAARDLLLSYDYPGNARELRYLVELAAIVSRSGLILPEHIGLPPTACAADSPDSLPEPLSLPDSLAGEERDRILSALERARWNRRETATNLGIPYSTLRYKMQKLGIVKTGGRS